MAKRRSFSKADKLRILTAAYTCVAPGNIGVLRREGIYLSHLVTWRKQRQQPFFAWYNQQHRHSGMGMMTPESVHTGRAAEVRKQRQATLQGAFDAYAKPFQGPVATAT